MKVEIGKTTSDPEKPAKAKSQEDFLACLGDGKDLEVG